jgi:hypothetical protein
MNTKYTYRTLDLVLKTNSKKIVESTINQKEIIIPVDFTGDEITLFNNFLELNEKIIHIDYKESLNTNDLKSIFIRAIVEKANLEEEEDELYS